METTKDSRIVPSLLKAAERLKSATSLTTTAAVVSTLLASVASAAFTHEFPAYALTTAAVVLAALGYGAVYQKEKRVEWTLGDYLFKSVSKSLKGIPPPRKKAALEMLFTLAEASSGTKAVRVFDLRSLALSADISVDEAREILEHLKQSGIVTYEKTTNEESVSLSHDLLVTLLLESRQRILLDLLYKEVSRSRAK